MNWIESPQRMIQQELNIDTIIDSGVLSKQPGISIIAAISHIHAQHGKYCSFNNLSPSIPLECETVACRYFYASRTWHMTVHDCIFSDGRLFQVEYAEAEERDHHRWC